MTTAKLHVTLPQEVWIGHVSASHPEAEFRVLAAFPAEETGVGLLEISSSDLRAVLETMDDQTGVAGFELHEAAEEMALVEFETTEPLLLTSIQEAGLPLQLPFTIEDSVATVEITASRERLDAFTTQLQLFEMPFDVEYVREMTSSESLLTDRQRELLDAAIEKGYYDTPRDCSLTDLAEATGVAKSTASETLHRVEEKIIKEYCEK